jgi:DNA-binding MarR family transcriptional regulator
MVLMKRQSVEVDVMDSMNYKSDMSDDEKTLIGVVRAAETFKRIVSAIFKENGLSFPQYNVLRVLDATTEGRSRITNVSKIMLVPGANVTGIAKRLEKNGYIVRKSDPTDERANILEITPKGKATLSTIEKDRDRSMHAMLQGFSKQEKTELLDKVKRLIKNSKNI